MWSAYTGELKDVNEALGSIGSGVDALKLPDKHSGLPADELEAIASREYDEEEAAAKAKAAGMGVGKTPPVNSR
jgi:hypothetical protein